MCENVAFIVAFVDVEKRKKKKSIIELGKQT